MSKKVKYGEVLVVDLEATCWDVGEKPDDQDVEIIEIGICSFNSKTFEKSKKMSIIVKPENSEISQYCTDLTGLSQKDVDSGVDLRRACQHLREVYSSHRRPWASWSSWDVRMIASECDKKNVPYPFTSRHIDIKTLFPLAFSLNNHCSLEKAMSKLGLKMEGVHHRGDDDAWNAATVLGECLRGGPLP